MCPGRTSRSPSSWPKRLSEAIIFYRAAVKVRPAAGAREQRVSAEEGAPAPERHAPLGVAGVWSTSTGMAPTVTVSPSS